MNARIIILNGASSSGKTTLAHALQDTLPGNWLHFGIDDLVAALPSKLLAGDGIEFGSDGQVTVGVRFRELERAWMSGLAATAQTGASLIIDDVFLAERAAQQRWKDVLGDLPVLWVGVHCNAAVAKAREEQRPDRTAGMHAQQAQGVHHGVIYDLEVDTSEKDAQTLAREISSHLTE